MKTSERSEKAGKQFDEGLNCAQSVVLAFADELKLKEETVLKLCAGFGGGMAKQQMTCGAVTGAYMVLGLMLNAQKKSNPEIKKEAAEQCLRFSDEFRRRHGSLICRELLGADMHTEEGKKQIEIHGLYRKICTPCVKSSVEILESILYRKNSDL